MTVVSLVVMEPGSEWPGHIGDSANLVAFSQGGDALLRRTREKLDELRRGRQDVRVAVLACNADADGEPDGCRAQVARTLLDAVSGATFGRFVLAASGHASLRLRQELLSLTGALTEQLRGTTATVSLRFTDASRGPATRTRPLDGPEAGRGAHRREMIQQHTHHVTGQAAIDEWPWP